MSLQLQIPRAKDTTNNKHWNNTQSLVRTTGCPKNLRGRRKASYRVLRSAGPPHRAALTRSHAHTRAHTHTWSIFLKHRRPAYTQTRRKGHALCLGPLLFSARDFGGCACMVTNPQQQIMNRGYNHSSSISTKRVSEWCGAFGFTNTRGIKHQGHTLYLNVILLRFTGRRHSYNNNNNKLPLWKRPFEFQTNDWSATFGTCQADAIHMQHNIHIICPWYFTLSKRK